MFFFTRVIIYITRLSKIHDGTVIVKVMCRSFLEARLTSQNLLGKHVSFLQQLLQLCDDILYK